MSKISMVLTLLSGVAFFLFGMSLMGDGLKKAAGNKLELILYRLTSNPLKGVLLGTVVTAVIQSSSATTVMVVGFVNSGMMKVAQSIGIIMGANIGTSITGWVLCLSYIDGSGSVANLLSTATISAIVAIIGIGFKFFSKKHSHNNVGDIMLGFAILMVGMQTMSSSVSSLKDNVYFQNVFTMFSNPFMGILVGILFTAILQSASASVGILQALSMTGAITFATAFPITLGIGVGAACPVLLSSMGTNKNGKRTALIYLLNDSLGMVIWGGIFYLAHAIVHFDFITTTMTPVRIALLNTVYRTLTVLVLAPFIRQIEKLVFRLIKDSPEDMEEQADFDLLEERFIAYPALALEQSHLAMNGMAKKSRKNIFRALSLFVSFSPEKYQKVQEKEALIDKYEDKLGTYLMQLTVREMTEQQSKQASKLLHTISDFERLSDHAVNLSYAAQELYEKKLSFSDEAKYELDVLTSAVKEVVDLTVNAFVNDNLSLATQVEPLRECITALCNELKLRHVSRLSHGKCKLEQGFAFNDVLTNLDRIAAHCSNIAVALIELEAADFDTHEYLKSIRELKNAAYTASLEAYEQKYDINGFKKGKKKAK
ncbi:MAG: Na/Pi cotransporter family protein [Lachnospiraceae bacterium]|nr:Na/Pi cotransporter family protein [Lachnospiraceae bacterium]